MSNIHNKESYLKVLEESKVLERIGRVIKTRTFPNVVKNIGFIKLSNFDQKDGQDDIKTHRPTLQLAEDTFKTLPSLRHSSYQIYRQTPIKDNKQKIEPLNTNLL